MRKKQSGRKKTVIGKKDGQKAVRERDRKLGQKEAQKTKQESFCYILIPEEAPVRKILSLFPEYEESAEIWTEWNVMELKLANETMFWEEAEADFSAEEDQKYIREHGIRQAYALTFDLRDQEEAQRILETVAADLGGRICKEEERL